MTTTVRVRLWIAAALLIVGVSIPLVHGRWLKSRTFVPVDKPITLAKGILSTDDFYINLPGTYSAEIRLDYQLYYRNTNPPCHVYGSDSQMMSTWKLFRNGEYLSESNDADFEFNAAATGLY